jgi:hypothetical protein
LLVVREAEAEAVRERERADTAQHLEHLVETHQQNQK